jgi:sialidase-1
MTFFARAIALLVLSTSAVAAQPLVEQSDLYVSGTEGYHTFRIPSLVVSKQKTVLAFCEGRKETRQDFGNIHLILKRSTDGGRTWGPLQLIYKEKDRDKVTCGNPCPVVDEDTGTIHLAFSRNNDRAFIISSEDDGLTWNEPKEITADVKKSNWGWYATGPGHGIQLKQGPHAGRLLVPCDHHESGSKQGCRSHMIYSDDHGKTWQLGKSVPLAKDATPDIKGEYFAGNECAVVETSPGEVYLNTRCGTYAMEHDRRQVSRSRDGGHTWEPLQDDQELIGPCCHAGLVGDARRGLVLFANPANGPIPDWDLGRIRMTVRVSYDGGRSWPASQMLHAGASSYSDLAVLPDGTILCLYEGGRDHRREWMRLARFPLSWIDAGRKPIGPTDAEIKPLKVCILSGCDTYHSEQSLPPFQAWLEANYRVLCNRLVKVSPSDLPGLESLQECDVALIFIKRMQLQGEQLARFKQYVQSGRPVVAVRTASHAVQTWLDFDQQVLGGNYQGHYDKGPVTQIKLVGEAQEHPVFEGVTLDQAPGPLYKNSGHANDINILATGTIPGHTEPVIWTRQTSKGRVFYTSLGNTESFQEEGFRRMIANALFWSVGRSPAEL